MEGKMMICGSIEEGESRVSNVTLKHFCESPFHFIHHLPYIVENKRNIKTKLKRYRVKIKGFRYYC